MAHTASFKIIKRLDEKLIARRSMLCPKQHKTLSQLIGITCKHYNHPKVRGEEDLCYCQVAVPLSE